MKITKLRPVLIASAAIIGFEAHCRDAGRADQFPNILWLVSEDNCPYLGCYGDTYATSPNIDRLASQGFTYTHCYANGPVSAAARNTIITGLYAVSGGNENMRSSYRMSSSVKMFPVYLREAGYYCTNNAKTDYNVERSQMSGIWDESSNTAHYRNRKPGQPFFAVFNIGNTHESALHKPRPLEQLRHDPSKVKLPPYHPDLPEIRHDWAQYYDVIEEMDSEVGKFLRELEESGEAENTIVMYYGDNGGILARSKRFTYETGTHVPFVMRIPDKYRKYWPADKPGSRVDRLISFVDLAPTLLSIAGIKAPEYMQGTAFLGKYKSSDPEYAFMFRGRMDERYDMCRAVRDKQFRYIRNFMPYRIYGQNLYYLWLAPSAGAWEKAFLANKCNAVQSIFWNEKPPEELYDTEHDPWEVNNLATNPAYEGILRRMRQANHDWMTRIRDCGVIPEADLAARVSITPAYDLMRSASVDYSRLLDAAENATTTNAKELASYLGSNESAIRYWGAVGMLMNPKIARVNIDKLKALLNDESVNVVVAASEALYRIGLKQEGLAGLSKALESNIQYGRLAALNSIESLGEKSPVVVDAVTRMAAKAGTLTLDNYDHRAAKHLLVDIWGIDPEKGGFKLTW